MKRKTKVWSLTMVLVLAVIITAVSVGVVMGTSKASEPNNGRFRVDHEKNVFLLDGEPFQYVSGSFHYFRALPEVWTDRLRTMRAAGLNALDTYVEWSLHNPEDGKYVWDGIANLELFIEKATAEGFYIILRPGPYICAERDNGGLPHWLFTKYKNIAMRTSDPNYIREVAKWYAELMPRVEKHMIGNGGRIIMVQVENEYGAFHACDKQYLRWLRDETDKYVKNNALLFTTDIPDENFVCGTVENVFATTDFGIDKIAEIDDIWKIVRSVQPTGPLVNSEFYPGWLTHWQEANQRRDPNEVANALRTILQYEASVNIYMFFGGTNFCFTAGANDFGYGGYNADITSYDYDAVMDEAGNTTVKYELVSKVIREFIKPQYYNFNAFATKAVAYGQAELRPVAHLLSGIGRESMTHSSKQSDKPLSFEEMNQYSGLVLYETWMPQIKIDPTLLTVNGLRDRAFVFVNQKFVGTLSRENQIYSLPLTQGWGDKLQILVENQGRINFKDANDTKGIFGDVTLQKDNGTLHVLSTWNTTAFPLEYTQIDNLLKKLESSSANINSIDSGVLDKGPVVFQGQFTVTEIGDSYLNTEGWGKGVIYINGFNLGRYWPLVGPQITVYVPAGLLKVGQNDIVFIEYQKSNWNDNLKTNTVTFEDKASLDAH